MNGIKFKELIVELSNNCNLSCKMCGFGQQKFFFEKFMRFELFQKVIIEIGKYATNIRLNGRGESTIHPKFRQMIDYTKNQCPNSNINLFTNISFRNKQILDSFINNDVQLFISIDSPNKEELENIRIGANYELIILDV